jgi:EAL domain-containing protein (putative c-di-GMP-specific phosphodiesterase class I)/ActR/RegA family two-component response regulator
MMHPSSPSLRRALVIDDDKAQGLVIASIAARNGYHVTNAQSFDAAAAALDSHSFQCITIDLSLGDHDGIEVLRLAARLAGVPRIIFISGCDDRILDAAVRMAESIGVTDACSLQKPFRPADLRGLFEGHVERASVAGPTRHEPVSGAMIERGLSGSEFYPLFQPKVSLSDGRLVGCEALARWNFAGRGLIPPSEFITAAEGSDHIGRLTTSILEQSIATASLMAAADADFKMAVNISPVLLANLSLPEEIDDLLHKHGVRPENLIVEVTESLAISDHTRAADILLRLRIKGVGVSIDDFGTGYSSLSSLARIPFTELKIDRSFVASCLVDDSMRKIVTGSVEIGHQFNMSVVAEGVETADVAQFLQDLGCDVGQGYLYARPLASADLLCWGGGRS